MRDEAFLDGMKQIFLSIGLMIHYCARHMNGSIRQSYDENTDKYETIIEGTKVQSRKLEKLSISIDLCG